MAFGTQIGHAYVFRQGKMLPVQKGAIRVRPDYAKVERATRSEKEEMEASFESSDEQEGAPQNDDTKVES